MKAVRIVNWIFLAVCTCLLIAIPILGVGSTAINWKGICYGFTDGQSPCSWWEFARNEMFWASMVIVPLLVITLGVWLMVNAIRWAVRAYRRTNSTAIK